MKSLFSGGYRGLSDSIFSGQRGSVSKSVGIDSRSKPGVLKAHQRLTKDSGTVVDELCKVSVKVSDGSRLWFSSESGKVWREVAGTYTLLTNFNISEWDVRTMAFTDQSLDVTANSVRSTVFMGIRNAGFGNTKFHLGRTGDEFIYGYIDTDGGYNLSDFAYDELYNHSAQTDDSRAYCMNSAGTKWYVSSATVIYQYSTGSNIDISSSSYDSKSFTPSETTSIWYMQLNTDGTKLYIGDDQYGTPTLYQYTLSTAFDISTATYDSVSFSFGTEVNFFGGNQPISFSPDGTKIIAYGYPVVGNRNRFYQYDLSTAYDLSTISYSKSWQYRSSVFNDNVQSIYLQTVAPYGIYPGGNKMFISTTSVTVNLNGSISTSSNGPYVLYELEMSTEAQTGIVLGAEEHVGLGTDVFKNVFSPATAEPEDHVYFATKDYLFKVRTSNIADIEENIVPAGTFVNGNSTHHPMVKQNSSLYIGDGKVVAQVDFRGSFTAQTNFNVQNDEVVTALAPFDLDVLVGTNNISNGRVLRWDGISETTSAEDIIYEKGGILAFILDDNFVYPVAGNRGSIYYYNGAKCEDFVTIPEIENQDTIKVNGNAIGYFRGTPLVGISNLSGNPVLQGIYGYGSYNSNYAKSLSLDFPMPSGQFSGVEIGAILTEGNDLYVAWKDGTDTGVAKIDWSNKYASAYFETLTLTQAMNRHQAKTVSDVIVPYHKLPASTGITIGINKDYDTAYTNMDVLDGTVRKVVKLKSPSTPDTINPQLRIGLTVNANDTPEIEDVLFAIASVGNK